MNIICKELDSISEHIVAVKNTLATTYPYSNMLQYQNDDPTLNAQIMSSAYPANISTLDYDPDSGNYI